MHFDYGYMEEGQLGKPYNIGLLKRLFPYARPYKKILFLALILTLAITLFDLSIPYLPKIAIDKYILSFWYQVNYRVMPADAANAFQEKYGRIVEATKETELGFLSSSNLKKIDPANLQYYQEQEIISRERFYRISVKKNDQHRLFAHKKAIQGESPYFYIPKKAFKGISYDRLLQLRQRDLSGVLLIGVFLLFFDRRLFFS